MSGSKTVQEQKNCFVFDEKFCFSVSIILRISCSFRAFIFYVHSSIMIQVFLKIATKPSCEVVYQVYHILLFVVVRIEYFSIGLHFYGFL